MNIFYENGEVENIDLLRYRLIPRKVNIAFEKYNLRGDKSNYIILKKMIFSKISYERNDGCDTHPHNLTAQLAAELGIFGLVFYILFYLLFYYRVFKVFLKNKTFIQLVIIYQ